MRYWTFNEVKDKVRRDLGLEQEEFITNEELKGYVNAAINEAEAEILTLYQDYFLVPHVFAMVNGQKEYDMPDDVFASKIRGLTYSQGGTIYRMKRFGEIAEKFERIQIAETIDEPYYRYFITNVSGEKPKIRIIPTPSQDLAVQGDDGIHMYYLRNANEVVNDDDVIDIPEFSNFIIQYCKVRCYEKEGHPNHQSAQITLERYREQMVATLNDKVPDGDTEIERDLTFYWDTV